ncbi:hypothetical protein D4N19_04760 [Klebsiella pneumoniae]|nr:hypothetical protein EAO22_13020 [Klebsiella pneumoniae]TXT83443.1 hypothetical protein D4N19_04760 [Klebsiella pneumoniae]HBU5051541.1 hypothetical protein [Klebsiella pneumoniae]HBW1190731.1 hypothetical protein [Klebsiella pneumoniae]
MRTCMIAGGNILFLFHYSFLSAISSLLHAVNKVILAAFIVGERDTVIFFSLLRCRISTIFSVTTNRFYYHYTGTA